MFRLLIRYVSKKKFKKFHTICSSSKRSKRVILPEYPIPTNYMTSLNLRYESFSVTYTMYGY